MYTGTAKNGGNFSPKTGLLEFKIMLVNPTKDELSELQGREFPFEPSYDLREDLNQERVRPIEFWVKNETHNIIEKVTFQVGLTTRKSKNDNVQVVNAKGIMRYAPSVEAANIKYPNAAPFIREVCVGEEALYRFMQCAMGYKYSDPEANFLGDSEANKITPASLFEGDVAGLKNFINFINEKGRKIGLVLAVKPKEVINDEGEKTIQNRQVLLNQPDFFFTLASGKVEAYSIQKFKDIVKEKMEAGVSLGSALFSYTFQEYKKEDCVNDVPVNPVATEGWKV